jgi:NADH-quinone oxidoreductase subunit H
LFCNNNADGNVFYTCRRKVAAWLQDRVVQTEQVKVAITTSCRWFKIILKEEFEPDTPTDFILRWTSNAMSTALMTSAVIPWGDRFHLLEEISYYKQLTSM